MTTDSTTIKIAGKLAGEEILSLEATGKGGNNRLFKVTTPTRNYALKHYPRTPGDNRDRQATESQALTFLNARGLTQVPRLYNQDQNCRYSLMEWITGSPVTNPTKTDLDAVLTLIEKLYELGRHPKAETLPMASAACLSGAAVEKQVRERLARLVKGNTLQDHPALARFIEEEFSPFLEKTTEEVVLGYRRAGHDYSGETPRNNWLLSPSDLGFHNTLRRFDQQLVFLDFEYFGWDDPAKMVCDFLHHPGMNIATRDKVRFIQGVTAIFQPDTNLPFRIKQLHPLFGLCWCMIILNEFIPEGWQRKVLATNSAVDRPEVLSCQLDKARQLLNSLGNDRLGLIIQ
jgi:hypothetical protein